MACSGACPRRPPSLVHRAWSGDSERVHTEHERKAIVQVTARLQARFPDVDPAVVEAAVRTSHSKITGPIREFVPLLVERAARDRLALARRTGTRRQVPGESRAVLGNARPAVADRRTEPVRAPGALRPSC